MSARPLHPAAVVIARALAIGGTACLVYPLAAVVLTVLNATVLHHDGYIAGHIVSSMPYLIAGAGMLVWPVLLHRGGRSPFRPRTLSVPWTVACAVAGLAAVMVLGWSATVLGESLAFDLTFIDEGNIGASFSLLGVWLAYFFGVPLAAVLGAFGIDALGRVNGAA
ncbi:MAG: hypothetical protein Q4G43_14315 [Mobilicoccus sp.]|nr:hypothetical protein [Mobilicoccus sp.]